MLSSMTTREVDGVSIVALGGRIVFGEESNALRVKVKELITADKQRIVLNMKNVEYIDSAGLGMLVAAYLAAKTSGASLCLCSLGSKFQELLQITKLVAVFQICSTEEAGIASFSSKSESRREIGAVT